MSLNTLEYLLPDFYRCAEQPAHWHRVLDLVRDEMEASSVVIQLLKREPDRFVQVWGVRDSISNQHAVLHDDLVNNENNPRLDLTLVSPPSAERPISRDEDRFTPHCPHFQAFRERLHLAGLGRSVSLTLKYADDLHLSMTLHRHADDSRDFSRQQEAVLCYLAPHLKQTVSLSEKVGQLVEQVEVQKQALDRINAGILTVDSEATVLWGNIHARRIMARSEHLRLKGARLSCLISSDQQKLAALLGQAATSPEGSHFVATLGQHRENPLQMLALPVHGSRTKLITLYLADRLSDGFLPESDIARVFGLTSAEARLASALCNDVSLAAYAERHGITVGTARIQLKSIFSKLGLSRQQTLVRLLCSSVVAKTLYRH